MTLDRALTEIRQALSLCLASHRLGTEAAEQHAQRAISSMMEGLKMLSIGERQELRKLLNSEEVALIEGVAFQAAIDAIVEKDHTVFENGLIALMIEDGQDDVRETLRLLSLLSHAASKVKFDLPGLYRRVRHFGSLKMVAVMDGWFSRPPQSIGSMAYVESVDSRGRFTFRSTIGRL